MSQDRVVPVELDDITCRTIACNAGVWPIDDQANVPEGIMHAIRKYHQAMISACPEPAEEAVAWAITFEGVICHWFDDEAKARKQFDNLNKTYPDGVRKFVPLYTHPRDAAGKESVVGVSNAQCISNGDGTFTVTGDPVDTAPAGQGATPETDALLNKNVNETNDALEIIQESLNDLTVHARDLERRLAEANSALAHAGAAHAGMREWKQLADDYKQKWLGAIDTLIVVGKAKEQAEAKLSQRPDQQELAKRLNDEYARVKCAAARGDTNIPGINLDLVRAAAAALSKEGK